MPQNVIVYFFILEELMLIMYSTKNIKKPYITQPAAAKYLKVTRHTIYRWIRAGYPHLKAEKVEGNMLLPFEGVKKFEAETLSWLKPKHAKSKKRLG
jgi:excisionase family DNA binding protein